MTMAEGLSSFWSSLITEKGLIPHVQSLMEIDDLEERGISLISRVSFLWCIGMKHKKESLEDLVLTISGILNRNVTNRCITCSELKILIGKNSVNQKSESESSPCRSNVKKERVMELSPDNILKVLKDKENVQSAKKQNVIKLSGRKLNELIVPNRNEQTHKRVCRNILVPETQDILVPNKMKPSPRFENLIIPETMNPNEQNYGNTDFFEDLDNVSFKSNSPELFNVNASPVLGKSRPHTPNSSKKEKKGRRSPLTGISKLKENAGVKPSIEELTMSKEDEHLLNQTINSTCNSPSLLLHDPQPKLLEKRDSITSLITIQKHPTQIENDFHILTQRSQSPASKSDQSSGTSELKLSSSTKSESPPNSKLKPQQSPRRPFTKSKSEMNVSVPRINRLSRIKTSNTFKDSKLNIEVEIDPKVRSEKKNYRQTKITENCFLKKTDVTKLTGGSVGKTKEHDENQLLTKVIRDSIRTSQLESIMRSKNKQLGQESPTKIKRLTPKKSTPSKVKTLTPSKMIILTPRKLTVKSTSTKLTNISTPLQETPSKLPKLSPQTKKRDLTPDDDSFSPLRKSLRLIASQGEGSSKEGQNQCPKMSEQEILDQLDQESRKVKSKPRRRVVLEDSFDVLPRKNNEPAFAFKEDVVRKKKDRKKLDGGECLECRDYFNSRGITEEERKEVRNKCSRHRSKHVAVSNTPEGFWQVGWSDED